MAGQYRWTLFGVFLLVSVALSVVLSWALGGWWIVGAVVLLPFLWWPRRGLAAGVAAKCPVCGRWARGPDERFCPRDGTPMDEAR